LTGLGISEDWSLAYLFGNRMDISYSVDPATASTCSRNNKDAHDNATSLQCDTIGANLKISNPHTWLYYLQTGIFVKYKQIDNSDYNHATNSQFCKNVRIVNHATKVFSTHN